MKGCSMELPSGVSFDGQVYWVTCPECGYQQGDMGVGVSCEQCDYGPLPTASKRTEERPMGTKLKGLTARQLGMYEQLYIMWGELDGEVPTVRAFQERVGLTSVSQAWRFYDIFVGKGLLRRVFGSNQYRKNAFVKFEMVL